MPPTIRAEARLVLALFLATAAGGCGAAGRGGTAGQGDTGTPREHPRQDCAPAALPVVLPAAAAVVDSAALLADLAGDDGWRRPGSYAVLSLTFDGGVALFPIVVRTDLTPLGKQAPEEALARLVRLHTLAQARGDSTWGARLRLDGGATLSLAIARQEICRPRAVGTANGSVSVGRTTVPIVIADRPLNFTMGQQPVQSPIELRVLVESDGSVASVEALLPRRAGVDALRRAVEETASAVRFYPALRDGVPERAWARLYAMVGTVR